jgi:uncharacterized protein YybS (DUF2232 family)
MTCLTYGLTAVALFYAAGLPVIGAVSLCTPAPIACCYFWARVPGLVIALAGTLLAAAPLAPEEARTAMLLFLWLAGIGLVMGECLRRNLNAERTVAYSALGALLVSAGAITLHAAASGTTPFAAASGLIDDVFSEVGQTLIGMGYVGPGEVRQSVEAMSRMLPAVIMLALGMLAGLNLAVARRVLLVSRANLPPWEPFRLWRSPEHLVWALIGSAGVLLLPLVEPVRLAGMNLLAISAIVYFLHGLAVLSFYLEAKAVPRPVRALIYVIIIFVQVLGLLVAVVGLADLWLDLRRLKPAAKEAQL